MKEVFKLAGKVVSVELNKDKEGNSRGHGTVEYEHPVEAVQAICILLLIPKSMQLYLNLWQPHFAKKKPQKTKSGYVGIIYSAEFCNSQIFFGFIEETH